MTIKNQPLIQFEEIDFDHSRQLLKIDYLDYKGEHRTIYTDFWDFEEWIKRNNYLSVDNEFRNSNSCFINQSVHQINIEDLLLEESLEDYRNKLAEDFFKELLNLHHVKENLRNKGLVKRLREEVLSISQELELDFKLSA